MMNVHCHLVGNPTEPSCEVAFLPLLDFQLVKLQIGWRVGPGLSSASVMTLAVALVVEIH